MPVGSDNISMQGIATSGSYETITNISLFTMIDTYAIGNPSGGNLKLNDMANKDYPSSTTNAASSITSTSMTCNGNVTADGGILGGITQRGFYFGTNSNYASNTKVVVSGTTGAYTLARTSLSSGVTYYITTYAINALGERQGNTVSQAAASVSLTSFIYKGSAGSAWTSFEAACEGGEEVSNAIGYSNNPPDQGEGFAYTSNSTANPFVEGWYLWFSGKRYYPFVVEGTQGAHSAIAEEACE